MKKGDPKRLALLTQIAEVKADKAKSAAAHDLRLVQELESRAKELFHQRKEITQAMITPDTALVSSRWLAACEMRVRILNTEMAIARANSNASKDHARFEEGRRQALSKLKDQAS